MANGVDIIQRMTHLDPNQLFAGRQAGRQLGQRNALFGQQQELNQLDLENKRREQSTASFKQNALQAAAFIDSGDLQSAKAVFDADPTDPVSANLSRRLGAGQTEQVRAFLGKMTGEQPKTFQKPFAVTGPGGDPAFGRVDESGNIGIVPGATPPKKVGQTINVDSSGQPLSFDEVVRRAGAVKGAEAQAAARAKRFQSSIDKIKSEGQAARGTIATVRAQMSIPATTGPGEDAIDVARRGAVALGRLLGVDDQTSERVQKITNLAGFKSFQESLVGDRLAEEPGVKTDSDAKRMRETLANTNNPVEANKIISGFILAEGVRKDNREKFLEENLAKGEENIDKLDREWNNFVRATPITGTSPSTGRIVFLWQFKEQNQGADEEELLEEWRRVYAK